MVKLTKGMKDFICSRRGYTFTVDDDGVFHVSSHEKIVAPDDEHLLLDEGGGGRRTPEFRRDQRITLTVMEPLRHSGYQVSGRAEMIEKNAGTVRITVEKVRRLGAREAVMAP